MLVAAQFDIPVTEFRPTMAKSVVTGFGRASKSQIKLAVSSQLGLAKPIANEHIADAFAVSICCVLSQGKASQATKQELQKTR
jgi:crossover junction endodeoxyribonuclease RuvC